MNKYNILAVFLISTLFSSYLYARQFIVVECVASPGYYAYISEPQTGKMVQVNSCGEALARVPADYYLLSSVGASRYGVKYLFGDAPITG